MRQRKSKFEWPKDVQTATKRLVQRANPLPAFIEDRCTTDPKGRCWMKDFYREYCDWSKEMGYTLAQQQRRVKENLEHLGYKVTHGNKGDLIQGLQLNSELEPQ